MCFLQVVPVFLQAPARHGGDPPRSESQGLVSVLLRHVSGLCSFLDSFAGVGSDENSNTYVYSVNISGFMRNLLY